MRHGCRGRTLTASTRCKSDTGHGPTSSSVNIRYLQPIKLNVDVITLITITSHRRLTIPIDFPSTIENVFGVNLQHCRQLRLPTNKCYIKISLNCTLTHQNMLKVWAHSSNQRWSWSERVMVSDKRENPANVGVMKSHHTKNAILKKYLYSCTKILLSFDVISWEKKVRTMDLITFNAFCFRSQLCINTGIVYMHRFYAFHSFSMFHRNSIAAAAFFLAAKVISLDLFLRRESPRWLIMKFIFLGGGTATETWTCDKNS